MPKIKQSQSANRFVVGVVIGFAIGIFGFLLLSSTVPLGFTKAFLTASNEQSIEPTTARQTLSQAQVARIQNKKLTPPKPSRVPNRKNNYIHNNNKKNNDESSQVNIKANPVPKKNVASLNNLNSNIENQDGIKMEDLIPIKIDKSSNSTNYVNNKRQIDAIRELAYGEARGLTLSLKNMDEIRKTKVKNKALFIAGIEGSGHHLWLAITQAMNGQSDLVVTSQYSDANLPKYLQTLAICI